MDETSVCNASAQDFLNKRLGGKSWTVTCTITCNGISLTTDNALPDTGASGYLFISQDLAKRLLDI